VTGKPDPDAFDLAADDYERLCSESLSVSGEGKHYFASGRVSFLRDWWTRQGRAAPALIVDVGCGVGDVAPLLAQAFPSARVLGVDPSVRSIGVALSRYASGAVSFGVSGGPEHLAALGQADLVHLNGVLHHVPPPERRAFARSVRDLLRRGAIASVFENNPWNPGTRYVMARLPFDKDAVTLTARELREHFRHAGLAARTTEYLFYFPRALRRLRFLEPSLRRLPLGAQYGAIFEAL
jgi:2-polyprenyl-3-methyl-5-hydroxy-6-metoxy-1,4-benzoquinol methylase